MPFPLSSIVLISLEVTRALVVLGYGLGFDTDMAASTSSGMGRFTRTPNPATGLPYPPLAITGCTGANVAPIVVTTAYPHGVSGRAASCGGLSCVIAGVGGNFAAMAIDQDPQSRTVGLPQGVLAVPLSPTTLALYAQNTVPDTATYGQLVPIMGTAAYTGGGTITPALTDGSILIGRPTTREHSAAPRIAFVPRGIAADKPGKPSQPNTQARNQERRVLIQQRTIAIDTHQFDVHAWGEASPPDPVYDYLATNALRDCVQSAVYDLISDAGDVGNGVWNDEKERSTQLIKSGHLLSFLVTMDVPVTDNPMIGGLPFVPDGTTFGTVVQSPTPEIAETFAGPTIIPS